MRTLKLFAIATLLLASLGLAACTGTDVSGTAGDLDGGAENPPPGAEQPPSKGGPGDVGGDKGSPGDVGGDKGGPGDVAGGGKQMTEKQLRTYLESLPPSQRVDFYYIEKDCNGCTDTASFKEYLERFCAAEPASCDQEFVALLTKQRTTTQIRNDQGLVGLPTAEQLLQAVKQFESSDQAAGGDAGAGGDAAGGDKGAGGDAGSGGDAGTAPGGGDAGGDTGSEPGGGDVGGDKSPIGLPPAPVASAQAVLAALEGLKFDTMSLAELSDFAEKSDMAALSSYFDAVSLADVPVPGCESCLDTINVLLGGQAANIVDLTELLNAIVANG